MKTTLFMAAMCVLGFTAFAQNNNKKNASTIVLVHGAWSEAHNWDAVVPLLQAQGHEVIAVNLPGHGSDTTSFGGINLQTYVNAVKNAIGDRKNVILVGHSMAGLVISQVAEEIPGQIRKLVYLAAYLPQNGESLLSLAKQDAGSHVGKYLHIDEKSASATIAKEGIIEVFAADAPAKIHDIIVNSVKPEPLIPLVSPVSLTVEKFGSVKKVYIHTQDDNAVSLSLQQAMVKKTPVSKVYTLVSSHTPFISMPDKLAAILLAESK